jgi:RHS repeat-associated protein
MAHLDFCRCLRFVLCSVAALCLFSGASAIAQTDPAAGIFPFSTQAPGILDSIDLSTSNINVQIPVRNKLGKIPFSYKLLMNSHAYGYHLSGVNTPTLWEINGGLTGQLMAGLSVGYSTTLVTISCAGIKYSVTEQSNLSIIDSTGASHLIPQAGPYYQQLPCGNAGAPGTFSATDGSGYTLVATPYTCGSDACMGFTSYDKFGNGSGYLIQDQAVIQDPDGATITESEGGSFIFTDSLGATAMTVTQGSNGSSDTYQYAYANGNALFQVNYMLYTQQTAFNCPNNSPRDISARSVYLPSSIGTPAGTILLTYETTPNDTHSPHYVTGRLAGITYATGGSVSYGYSGGNNGATCTVESVVPLLTKIVADNNGNTNTWTYANTFGGLGQGSSTTTVTDPAGNQTIYTFNVLTGQGRVQTEAQYYQGTATGTPLKTKTTQYTLNSNGAIGQTDEYVSLNGAASNHVTTTLDIFGNVTSMITYDFGGTALLSSTYTFYGQSWNGTSCTAYATGTYIFSTPCYSHTENSSGTDVTKTKITYSNTGHATSEAKWISGSNWLITNLTYGTNGAASGVLSSVADVNGAITNYNYNGTNGCNGMLVTSIALPVDGLTETQQWNCNGGVVTETLDANSQPTNYTYNDPLWRVTSMADALNNTTNYFYTPTTFESVLNFNGTTSTVDKLTTMDGLGRPIFFQTRQAQGTCTKSGQPSCNFDSVQTAYNWSSEGAITTVTVPYVGTAGQPAPSGTPMTTTQLDALGRSASVVDGGGGSVSVTYTQNDVLSALGPPPSGENLKQRQFQYDGLGRLSSVCELTSTTNGGGNCQQSAAQTGYWTQYSYSGSSQLTGVNQNTTGTPQSRGYQYDGLGRMTFETNPEWGPGSASYTYDSDSTGTCPGTYKGDLVKRVDNAGNTTCYTYDGLHRMLSSTYLSSNPNPTTNKYFVYDAATVNQQTMGNANGRMAEAYTATCATCTKLTDEGMSYDVLGRLAQFYESTPNSGGYYSLPTTFWPNGQLNTIGPFLGIQEVTIAPDGEGRQLSVSGAAANIAYNAASLPTQVPVSCEGSTCFPIGYQYDPYTVRMTQYSFAGSNYTMTGTLTWNSNGSLGQLVIVDPSNSADNQSCNYSADDLARLASVSCNSGATWGQQFSYDAFGNITKTVPSGATGVSWIPGYNQTTNQYTLSGTKYDSDGNVLNDSFNSYTWDAEGKTLSTAYYGGETWSFTYDAFGHTAEVAVNGSYFRSYLALGRYRFEATGQSAEYSEVPLPGGSIFSTGSGDTGIQIADWLGTIRGNSNYTGGILNNTGARAPFGEAYVSGGADNEAFTGQDGYGGITWFPERNYASVQGRWLSPDPAGMKAANLNNPQSWNRYAYALNNPLRYTDPLGLYCFYGGPGDTPKNDSDPTDYDFSATGPGDCGEGGQWIDTSTVVNVNSDGTEGPTFEDGQQIFPETVPFQPTFGNCVKSGTDYFSLQHGLQAISGGSMGNSWAASAFLGSSVSSAITLGQYGMNFIAPSPNAPTGAQTFSSTAGEALSDAAGPAASRLASSMPNLAFTVAATAGVGVQTPTTSVGLNVAGSLSGTVPLNAVASTGAKALNILGTVKLPFDLAVGGFSALVCSIGR